MAAPAIQFPLSDVQMSLLKLTENLPQEDLQALKAIINRFKACKSSCDRFSVNFNKDI